MKAKSVQHQSVVELHRGRITVPAAARQAMGIESDSSLLVITVDGGVATLEPAQVVTRDEWLRTNPKVRAAVARAKAERSSGSSMTAAELSDIATSG